MEKEYINKVDSLKTKVYNYINAKCHKTILLKDSIKWDKICDCLDKINETLHTNTLMHYTLDGKKYYSYDYRDKNEYERLTFQREAIIDLYTLLNDKDIIIEKGICNEKIKEEFMLKNIEILNEIVKYIDIIDKDHKKRWIQNPLSNIIASDVYYNFEKIYDKLAIDSPDKSYLFNLSIIKNMIGLLENAIIERNEIEGEEYEFRTYKNALLRIENHVLGKEEFLNEFDLCIYAIYIDKKYKYFLDLAKEIDKKYCN